MDTSVYLLKMGSQESTLNLAFRQFYRLVVAIHNQFKQWMLCTLQNYLS